MAGGIDWFRWHHGSVNDQKFGLIAKRAGASVAEVVATWACLLEQASASDDRGNPGDVDFESIDFALGMADGTAKRIHERMSERGLVDSESGRIAAWEKRQPKRERADDNSSGRVRAFRERQRQEGGCNATKRHETTETNGVTPGGSIPSELASTTGVARGVEGSNEANVATCGSESHRENGVVTPRNATKRHETPRGEERREDKKDFCAAPCNGTAPMNGGDSRYFPGVEGCDEDGEAPVASLPLVDGTAFSVSDREAGAWAKAYPAVDVPQQLAAMGAWLDANPKNRKTRNGVRRFVVGWLSREQDRAARVPSGNRSDGPRPWDGAI